MCRCFLGPDTTTCTPTAIATTLTRGGAKSDRHTTRYAGRVVPPQTVTVGPTQTVRAIQIVFGRDGAQDGWTFTSMKKATEEGSAFGNTPLRFVASG